MTGDEPDEEADCEIPPCEADDEKETEAPKADASIEQEEKEVEIAPIPHRVVGELFNCYVVVELEDKFLLVDKHAAHERINFEKLKAGMKKTERPSQFLMLPIDVMLTSEEVHIISEYRAEIEILSAKSLYFLVKRIVFIAFILSP